MSDYSFVKYHPEVQDRVLEAIQKVLDDEARRRGIPRQGQKGEDLRTARPSLLSADKREELAEEVARILREGGK